MKNVRVTCCTLATAKLFTRSATEVLRARRTAKNGETKVTTAKRQIRAGATPLFAALPPKRFVGSLPPCGTIAVPAFLPWSQEFQ